MAAMPRPPQRGAHINNRPPPSLPPRSGGHGVRPLPAHPPSVDSDTDPDDYLEPDSTGNAPEEIYDDCNENDDLLAGPDEVYDDCGDQPPPLPPLPVSQPEEFYDDFDEQPKPPARPPAKLPPPMMQPPQENYDDLDNVGPVVVQKLPRVRQPPPSPAPPPPEQGIVEDVYEDPDASQPATPPHRGPSPPRNPPPGRSWAKIPEPPCALRATSPGRSKSPSRLHERSLPPLPPSKENRTQPGDPRSQPLPPIPPVAASARGGSPARSGSPAPIPAARGNRRKSPDHQGQYSRSPVVVPLKQHHAKGDLPPLPPGPASEEYDDDDDSGGGMTLQDNGWAENYAEQGQDFDAEDPTTSPDLHEESEDEHSDEDIPPTDSESEEFPPPPSPLLKRTGMLASSHSHPYSPPPLPSTLPPASNNHSDDVYEVGFEEPQNDGIRPPPPPPPPPPPKEQSRPQPARLPPQPKPPASTPAPSGPGSFAIDLGQLKDLRAGLRKVSVGAAQDSNSGSANAAGSSTGPKVYGECAPTVASAKKMFQDRAIGKPGVSAPKPAITPKFGTWKGSGNDGSGNNNSNTVVRPPLRSTSPKPPLPPPSQDKSTSQVPDVTFLPKPNKDKHTNVPVKYEPPPPEETFESDDIYDDAASVDTMHQYDWYHGYLDRKPAEAKVKAVGKDGTYLVRVSEKDPRFPYTLVVLQKGHVNNLRIRHRSDNKFALGDEKADELTFPDVPALINHHKNHHVVLLGGGSQSQVVLQITPPKS